jgi:hypothetical protein
MRPHFQGKLPVLIKEFNKLHTVCFEQGMQSFSQVTLAARQETTFSVFEAQANTGIESMKGVFMKQNNEKIKEFVDKEIAAIVQQFREQLTPIYALLPLEDNELIDHTRRPQEIALNGYPNKLENFTDAEPYKEGKIIVQVCLLPDCIGDFYCRFVAADDHYNSDTL